MKKVLHAAVRPAAERRRNVAVHAYARRTCNRPGADWRKTPFRTPHRSRETSLPSPGVCSVSLPSRISRNEISGCDSAILSSRPATALPSAVSFFKNFMRGRHIVENVPHGDRRAVRAAGVLDRDIAAAARGIMRGRPCCPAFWVMRSTCETAEIEASASPRKPSVRIASRSSLSYTLLVAWRRNAVATSSRSMPQPLSVTRIYVTPPRRISTVTIEAPASIEFSTSSLMTEEGRSTTSPAAISSATCLSSTLIFGIFCTCLSFILSEL